ncbi:MAG: SapC family protein [Methyloversatilis sp. 12-65-5]|nr:MAG: SapC family protein [Methyloversatilis sp. 12-65-5]
MKTLLFYDSVVVLNRDTHRDLHLKPQDNLRFAASTNCVPLALVEFGDVAREYPIVFARLPGGLVPVALLGLRDAENLYLNDEGKWDARYVPAFVRRYPFVAVQDNTAPDKLLVCMDEQFPGFNKEEGERLFDENGAETPFLKNALAFVQGYQNEAQRTAEFCREVEQLGLLNEMSALAELKDGRKFRLDGLWVIDEAKLQSLSAAAAVDLFRRGWMGLVYAQLLSLGHLRVLLDRTAQRSGEATPADGTAGAAVAAAESGSVH